MAMIGASTSHSDNSDISFLENLKHEKNETCTLCAPLFLSEMQLQRSLSITSSNALENFSALEEELESKRLIILLDYDGTLTPIVNDPSKALLSEEVRETLRLLPKHFVTGIVTGRSLAKIRNFVNVPELFYAGSHGFDILAPIVRNANSCQSTAFPYVAPEQAVNSNADVSLNCQEHSESAETNRFQAISMKDMNFIEHKSLRVSKEIQHTYRDQAEYMGYNVRYQVAGEFLPVLQHIRLQLVEALHDIPGAEVEDNVYSISVHYRNCARSYIPLILSKVTAAQNSHAGIRFRQGKEVFELQPDVQWNKGSAVEWVLDMLETSLPHTEIERNNTDFSNTLQLDNRPEKVSEAFTIFIGDDKTDEDAFELFNNFGGRAIHKGMGILVSEESRSTHAAYTLKNPTEVAELLNRLVNIGQTRELQPVRIFESRDVSGKFGVSLVKNLDHKV